MNLFVLAEQEQDNELAAEPLHLFLDEVTSRIQSSYEVFASIHDELMCLRRDCSELQNEVAQKTTTLKKRRRETLKWIDNLKYKLRNIAGDYDSPDSDSV